MRGRAATAAARNGSLPVPMRRWVSLGLLLAAALPWSLALSVVGLWVLLDRPGRGLLADPWVSGGVGAAAFAGGQLVFMVCVSSRVFPRADRRITVPAEGVMAAVFVLGVASASGGVLWHGGTA